MRAAWLLCCCLACSYDFGVFDGGQGGQGAAGGQAQGGEATSSAMGAQGGEALSSSTAGGNRPEGGAGGMGSASSSVSSSSASSSSASSSSASSSSVSSSSASSSSSSSGSNSSSASASSGSSGSSSSTGDPQTPIARCSDFIDDFPTYDDGVWDQYPVFTQGNYSIVPGNDGSALQIAIPNFALVDRRATFPNVGGNTDCYGSIEVVTLPTRGRVILGVGTSSGDVGIAYDTNGGSYAPFDAVQATEPLALGVVFLGNNVFYMAHYGGVWHRLGLSGRPSGIPGDARVAFGLDGADDISGVFDGYNEIPIFMEDLSTPP